MHMSTDNLGNSSGQKIPDHDPAIIAANREQRASSVERGRHCYADRVQCPVVFLYEKKHPTDFHTQAPKRLDPVVPI